MPILYKGKPYLTESEFLDQSDARIQRDADMIVAMYTQKKKLISV